MRLYEALLTSTWQLDTVVIRFYNSEQEEATPSVVDDKEEEHIQSDMMDTEATPSTGHIQPDMMDTETTTAATENDAAGEGKSATKSTNDADEVTNSRLTDAIRAMDERKDPKKKKKSSTAATKAGKCK
jgi:hypothetical protein